MENKFYKRSILLKLMATISLIMLLLTGSITYAIDNGVDEKDIVAIVNGESITVKEYLTMAKLYGANLNEAAERNCVLDNLINDKVIVQYANKQNIVVTDEEVKEALEETINVNFAGDEKKFNEQLAAAGFTMDMYIDFQKVEITKSRLQENYITTNPEEVKKYFEQNKKKLGTMVEASHILVDTKKEAQTIIQQLKKGANFAQLAAQKSIEPNAKKTKGYLGWFIKGVMVPEFEKAAFSMKVGQFSAQPVKTEFGYHVIKLHNKKPAEFNKIQKVLEQIIVREKYEKFNQEISKAIEEAKVEKKIENIPTKFE